MNKMKNNFILILIRVFAFYYFQDCDLLFNFYMDNIKLFLNINYNNIK